MPRRKWPKFNIGDKVKYHYVVSMEAVVCHQCEGRRGYNDSGYGVDIWRDCSECGGNGRITQSRSKYSTWSSVYVVRSILMTSQGYIYNLGLEKSLWDSKSIAESEIRIAE